MTESVTTRPIDGSLPLTLCERVLAVKRAQDGVARLREHESSMTFAALLRPRRAGSSRCRRARPRASPGSASALCATGSSASDGRVDGEARTVTRLAVDDDGARRAGRRCRQPAESPRPVPSPCSFVVKNGSKTRGACVRRDPGAGVADRERDVEVCRAAPSAPSPRPSTRCVAISMHPPVVASLAFTTRFKDHALELGTPDLDGGNRRRARARARRPRGSARGASGSSALTTSFTSRTVGCDTSSRLKVTAPQSARAIAASRISVRSRRSESDCASLSACRAKPPITASRLLNSCATPTRRRRPPRAAPPGETVRSAPLSLRDVLGLAEEVRQISPRCRGSPTR